MTNAAGPTEIWGIWGSSPSNLVAVGQNGAILRFDGTSWTAMTSPVNNALFGVWGSGPSDIYAVGVQGTLLHYDGSTWDVAFSRDPEQRYMYIADGKNMRVNIVDRQSLQLLSSFGSGGQIEGDHHDHADADPLPIQLARHFLFHFDLTIISAAAFSQETEGRIR